jgi:hypothetical protein
MKKLGSHIRKTNTKYDTVFIETYVDLVYNKNWAKYVVFAKLTDEPLYTKILDKTITQPEYNNNIAKHNWFKNRYKDEIDKMVSDLNLKRAKKVKKETDKEVKKLKDKRNQIVKEVEEKQLENRLSNDMMLNKIVDIYNANPKNGMVQLKAIELYYKITTDLKKDFESDVNRNNRIFNISFNNQIEEENTVDTEYEQQ